MQTVPQTAQRRNVTSLQGCLEQCDGGSAVLLPKALKGWPQINAFAQPESFLAAKGTARPLIALLICEIRRLMELLFQPGEKTKTKPSV